MGFLDDMFKPIKTAGKWVVHAAEDTFSFGKDTVNSVVNLAEKTVNGGVNLASKTVSGGVRSVGSAGKTLLNFTDTQTSKLENVLTKPSFILIAGCVVVAIILIR